MNRAKIFPEHILGSIETIEEYVKDVDEKKFNDTISLQDMVIRRLEIIGEAVKNIPAEFKEKHKDIEWKKVAGLRDVLIHSYFDIDLELTWKVITSDIPLLRTKIQDILKTL